MEKVIDKNTIEGLLIILYKLEEFEACESLLGIYKRYCNPVRKLH